MAQFCLHCRVAADDYKRFCGRCGRPLAPAVEAEAQLRRELQDAPGDSHILEQFVHLLEVDGSREIELAELRLQWCEALLTSNPQGEQLDLVRGLFTRIPKALLPPAAMERAVKCLTSLYGDEGASERLAEEAAAFSRDTRGKLPDAARVTWIQACLGWGDAEKERRPRWASTFYEYASDAGPRTPELAGRLEGLRAIEARLRTQKLMVVTGVVALVILVAVALLAFQHFTTAQLMLTTPDGFQDARVWVTAVHGQAPTLRTERPGVYEGAMRRGRYTAHISKQSFVDWETTLALPGARKTILAFPSLDLTAEAKRAAEEQRQVQMQEEARRRVDDKTSKALVGQWGEFSETPYSNGKRLLIVTVWYNTDGRYEIAYGKDEWSTIVLPHHKDFGSWRVSNGIIVRNPGAYDTGQQSLRIEELKPNEFTWTDAFSALSPAYRDRHRMQRMR